MAFVVPKSLFSSAEIQKHRSSLDAFVKAASGYLDWVYADDLAFQAQWGVAKYHSDLAASKKALRISKAPDFLTGQLVGLTAIQLALQALARGFNTTAMQRTWLKIVSKLDLRRQPSVIDLQLMLQQLGWSLCYWNPDPRKNAFWDAEEQKLFPLKSNRKWMPVWGGHALRYASVRNKGLYGDVWIDDSKSLVGFDDAPAPGFARCGFFIGSGHMGHYSFTGRDGNVFVFGRQIGAMPLNSLAYPWTGRSGLVAVPTPL